MTTDEQTASMILDESASLRSLSLESLSQDAIHSYRDLFRMEHEDHPWTRLSDDDFLIRLNAITRNSDAASLRPTEAGLLMFGFEHEITKVFPGYVLDYRHEDEEGTITRRIVSNDGMWSGCLFDFWQQVSPLLSQAAQGSLKTAHSSATLSEAAKEGLANALVHSDYYGRRHLVVIQHADRIEYSNPGDLRVRASVALQGGITDPRNPHLMKMFSLIGACSDAGSGLSLIANASEHAGVFDPILSQQHDPARTLLTLFLREGETSRSARMASNARTSITTTSIHAEDPESGSSASFTNTTTTRTTDPLPDKPLSSQSLSNGSSLTPSASSYTSTAEVPMTQMPSASPPSRLSLFDRDAQSLGDVDVGAPPGSDIAHSSAAPRSQLGEDEAAIVEALTQVSDPDLRAVIGLFRDRTRLKRSDVETLLGVGSTKAKAIVADLVSDGIIDVEGGGRSTFYRLAKK